MNLTFITNATCIYEYQGYRLLCDPWLSPTAFYGSWVHLPPIKTTPQDLLDVDGLYISHIHEDHCDPETLKYFRKQIPIFTLKDRLSLCAKKLAQLGFSNVTALADREFAHAGPFQLTMFGPFVKHPHVDCEIGNVVDSALLVRCDAATVLNTNDNSPSVDAARRLREDYGPITVAQLNYNSAGPYPACFQNLTQDQKREEASRHVARNLDHMVAVAKELRPEFVMPFAGAYELAPHLGHKNEYLGTTSPERAALACQEAGFKTIVLGEGEHATLG